MTERLLLALALLAGVAMLAWAPDAPIVACEHGNAGSRAPSA